MDYTREIIESVVYSLREIEKKYTEEYRGTLDGNLICNYNHDRYYFYHAQTVDEKYVRKRITPLSSEGQSTLKQLARKEYLRKALLGIHNDIGLLEEVLRNYVSLDATSMIEAMRRPYRMLDASWFFFKDAARIRRIIGNEIQSRTGDLISGDYSPLPKSKILLHKSWAEEPYERNPHPFGDDEIYTSDGTRARSKAEAMIYEGLQKYRVPFRFDALITKVGEDGIPFEFAPDFIFEDANMEEFYWEFCGMMDNEDYVQRHLIKRESYEKAGIVPWKNIIYSYSSGNDIDMAYVESVIRNQIIPRL